MSLLSKQASDVVRLEDAAAFIALCVGGRLGWERLRPRCVAWTVEAVDGFDARVVSTRHAECLTVKHQTELQTTGDSERVGLSQHGVQAPENEHRSGKAVSVAVVVK